jgi:hypothetical protein
MYEDRAFGGAGLDILIGNTGGDRLIDWVGEFNSYIVPFAPFGIATVSRQVPPQLFDFLYAQAASDGADLTRPPTSASRTPRAATATWRTCRPSPTARWAWSRRRTTACGRTRPAARPTRSPATSRAAARRAAHGRFQRRPGAGLLHRQRLMGHRDASGWHVDRQAAFPGSVKAETNYNLLLALNGTVATLVVNNKNVFTHVFQPRMDEDGFTYGLNAGLVGLGANNAIARIDNVVVQVLPPEWTLEIDEDFGSDAGVLDPLTGDWSLVNAGGGRYVGAGEPALSTFALGSSADSYVELSAKLRTGDIGGLAFDVYGPKDFKFVALSAATDQVLIGHVKGGAWKVDASVARTINDNTDYTLGLQLKGTTVSVTLNGQAITGYAFNGLVVDGDVGLLAEDGSASFDSFGVKSNDADLIPLESESLVAAGGAADGEGAAALTQDELNAVAEAAIAQWMAALGENPRLGALAGLRFAVAELPGAELAREEGGTITLDADAAGHGWFVDTTPHDSSEFALRTDDDVRTAIEGSAAFGAMDLLTAVRHEIGHALGFDHDDGLAVMRDELATGVRYEIDLAGDEPVQAPRPAAPFSGAFEVAGGAGTDAAIDWHAGLGDGWNSALSPYESGKPSKKPASDLAEFKLTLPAKPKGFDRLGGTLLGRE